VVSVVVVVTVEVVGAAASVEELVEEAEEPPHAAIPSAQTSTSTARHLMGRGSRSLELVPFRFLGLVHMRISDPLVTVGWWSLER
jgi:hypothetical protein